MELLLMLGLAAAVILLLIGGLILLQQRRSGTIRAVIRPRRPSAEHGGASNARADRER
jgi:hypothetical protein